MSTYYLVRDHQNFHCDLFLLIPPFLVLVLPLLIPHFFLSPTLTLYNTVQHRLAKKSFTGYLRSLQLLPGKLQQDVTKLPLDAFAISLGLGMTPEAPVAPQGAEEREGVREKKNVNRYCNVMECCWNDIE